MIFSCRQLLTLLFLPLLTLTFFSCDPDRIEEETAPDGVVTDVVIEEDMPALLDAALLPPPDADGGNGMDESDRRPCFRFIFPVQLVLRNGTVVTAEDGEDLRTALRRIRNAEIPANFVYPFDVTLVNGNTVTVSEFAGFRRLRNFCDARDNAADEPCFTYNFPIALTVNGRPVTVESGLAWRRVLRAAGRDAAIRINFPITVMLTGTDRAIVVENRAQLNRLRHRCDQRDDDRQACFTFQYPLDLLVGEEVTTVDSRAAWLRLLNRTPDDVAVRLAFPVTITLVSTDEAVIVESADGWSAVRDLCN